jgi:hypothetical protein
LRYLGQDPKLAITGDYTSGWRIVKKIAKWFGSHRAGGDAKTARFYAEQWAKEHPNSGFDPSKYTDEQILQAFRNGAFSKTAGDRLDPLQLLGIITVFRGGPTLIARPGVDIKIDKTTGLVQPGRGVSVSSDAAGLQRFGGAYKVESLPKELELIQRVTSRSRRDNR